MEKQIARGSKGKMGTMTHALCPTIQPSGCGN